MSILEFLLFSAVYNFPINIFYFKRIRNHINVLLLHLSMYQSPSLFRTVQCSLMDKNNIVNSITVKLIHRPIKSNNTSVRHLPM